MIARGLQSLLLLCITLMLTASLFVAGTQLTEEDELAHQQLQDHLIKQQGLRLARKDVFESLNLQSYKDNNRALAVTLDMNAWYDRKIVHSPSPSPPRPSSLRPTRVHVNNPIYYLSVIKPESHLGPTFETRPANGVNRVPNVEPNPHPNRGKEVLAFWKYEGTQKQLLALDLWPYRVDWQDLRKLEELIPNHLLAEIH